MATSSKSKSYSRRSIGAVLLVGVLSGITVGGGVGVFAASSTKTVTVCVDKKDNHMNYSKDSKCKSHQYKVVLNQKGVAGAKGAAGAAGAKGDTGVAGAKGDTGAAGAKGDTGAAGTNGTNGTAGTNGTNGTNGAAGIGGSAITQQSVCDGTDLDTTANELCKIGMTGPGGGHIFFVDYNDEYTGFDYLEAAPVGWGNGIPVGAGETTGSATVDPKMKWCSDTSSLIGVNAWSNRGVGAGASNTSTADTTCASGAIQAASDYAGGTKDDWYLGSNLEMKLMFENLNCFAGCFGMIAYEYWSSSEALAGTAFYVKFLSEGDRNSGDKSFAVYVRPVRAF